jgi:uncharacterized protein (DUF924 family)
LSGNGLPAGLIIPQGRVLSPSDGTQMQGSHPSTNPAPEPWVGEVLDFWFRELGPEHWFSHDARLDTRIRDRFLSLHERLVLDGGHELRDAESILAAVIVVDQFSRNMFRGTARAFATDDMARRLAKRAVDARMDATMTPEQRLFLYLPFQHSEDRSDQAASIELTRDLHEPNWLKFAEAHKAIIDRFGRFPHRNAALRRASTPEELAFLQQPGSAF